MERQVEYVTVTIGGQLFGLPIARVQDVFAPDRLTRVPLARPEIAGLLNVRGRILTIIDMRRRLGVEPVEESRRALAVGIEHNGQSYGLLIDSVGEVLKLPARSFEDNPINFDRTLAYVSAGVHRLDGRLMVVLDLDRVLQLDIADEAA
ncbi:MAG TPA: chemotaxis protein CheW [Xanthobacteraceae bacterium]|jgi:purine-binding chemotaxis protein CheW